MDNVMVYDLLPSFQIEPNSFSQTSAKRWRRFTVIRCAIILHTSTSGYPADILNDERFLQPDSKACYIWQEQGESAQMLWMEDAADV